MAVHSGWQITLGLLPLVTSVPNVQADATELSVKRLESLQGSLRTDTYFVILSCEGNVRSPLNRKPHEQSERPNIIVTIVGSIASDRNDTIRRTNTGLFMEKVDEIHHAIIGQTLSLPSPFSTTVVPYEAVELPSDEALSQLSLRIRQLQYQFQCNRSGA